MLENHKLKMPQENNEECFLDYDKVYKSILLKGCDVSFTILINLQSSSLRAEILNGHINIEKLMIHADFIEKVYNKVVNNEIEGEQYSVACAFVMTLSDLLDVQKNWEDIEKIKEKLKKMYLEYYDKEKLFAVNYIDALLKLLDLDEENVWIIEEIKDLLKKPQLFRIFESYKNNKMFLNRNFLFDDFVIEEKEPIEKKLNSIFEKLNEDLNRGDIKVHLMSLLIDIINLKKSSNITLNGKSEGEIVHYTKFENLKFIFGVDTISDDFLKTVNPTIRLYNAEYMNDPSEGKIFIELLKKQFGEKTDKYSILNNLIETCYSSDCDSETTREEINRSHVYLGSFSSSVDKLPMWSQYGNDGKGCCLVIKEGFFDRLEKNNFDVNALKEDFISEDIPKYVLYKVTYTDNQQLNKEDEQKQSEIINKIAESLVELEKCLQKIFDISLKEEIEEFIIGALDQVRFLYKDISYEHEKELRLVKFSETAKQDDNPNFIVPKLFVEVEKPIEYQEVILGPKVEQPSLIAPFLYNTKKVKKVTRSSIKYR